MTFVGQWQWQNLHLDMPERVDKAEYTKRYVQSLDNVPLVMNADAKEYIRTMSQQVNVKEPSITSRNFGC